MDNSEDGLSREQENDSEDGLSREQENDSEDGLSREQENDSEDGLSREQENDSEDGLSREQENDSEDGLSREQEKKIVRQSRIVELRDRVLLKDRSADRAVMEEVFDKSTLMVVYGLLNQEVIKEIFGVMKSGKESRIYTGIGAQDNRIAI